MKKVATKRSPEERAALVEKINALKNEGKTYTEIEEMLDLTPQSAYQMSQRDRLKENKKNKVKPKQLSLPMVPESTPAKRSYTPRRSKTPTLVHVQPAPENNKKVVVMVGSPESLADMLKSAMGLM